MTIFNPPDPEELKKYLDGIDTKTKIVVIYTQEEFNKIVLPKLERSVVKRLGKWVVVALLAGALTVGEVWLVLHEHFPSYVPIAEVAIANTYQYAQEILRHVKFDGNGLIPQTDQKFDYKYVDLGTGYYPLPSIPPQYQTGQYIHTTGQKYI